MPDRALTMTALMTNDMANAAGHVHGGRLMHFFDNVAYACASRYCRKNVVTSGVKEISFKLPLLVGDLVTVHAEIEETGRTSMTVSLRVEAEHLRMGDKRTSSGGIFIMVALDESGRPTPVPRLPSLASQETGGTSAETGGLSHE